MDLNKQQDDPHGVQALLARLRQQQDAASSSTSSAPSPYSYAPASSTAATNAPIPGLADSYAYYPSTSSAAYSPASPAAAATAPKRRTYNVQPRYGTGHHFDDSQAYDPYGPAITVDEPISATLATKRKHEDDEARVDSPSSSSSKSRSPPNAKSPDPSTTSATAAGKAAPPPPNLRDLSFPAALPHLTELSQSSTFLSSLSSLKKGQDDLERSLHASYARLQKTLSRPGVDPKTRKYEQEKLARSLLQKWEEETARQQRKLEECRVPCCFETEDVGRRKRMRRVVEVAEGMLDE
ncbi:uncharacterized protein PFL1_01328 [Pseudozyma flocculosa PF-1]|uniref:Uncharacterized protein n=1 Tax=Pseudozyma flocculosa TaxID=84751 RepID=A0A5C3EVC7_9BASI|nr:uncharacterized protein PFL1_01328 [Pseudozyma flocculosa PF-1]EPQ31139.1 hypothetical protein PFL1_01328 [Pseudozyma flocculosa PF-1]SPO36002.1 uncharacterized protein PSFLO_01473 [Pseudozyma flocculosa]